MAEQYGEIWDKCSLIRAVLESYPGNSILRELIQNSDDARATSQTFILDERQFGTNSLYDPALEGTQGPALLAVNDTVFSERDWEALRRPNDSSKKEDLNKTGKYGIGFRAVYHVTDNPQVLSTDQLAIFDPHDRFREPYVGGIKRDFVKDASRFKDQLSSFRSALERTDQPYNGTIVRLPLRQIPNEISSNRTTSANIRTLFRTFNSKELRVALLFLRNVKQISLKRFYGVDSVDPSGNVSVDEVMGTRYGRTESIWTWETVRLDISTKTATRDSTELWRKVSIHCESAATEKHLGDRLNLPTEVIKSYMAKEKLAPFVDLAMILSSSDLDGTEEKGRLFTLLPLPVYTKFPVHVNGMFALTTDRQSLRNETETGISSDSRERFLVEWNKYLFDTIIPAGYAKALRIAVEHDFEYYPLIYPAFPSAVDPEQPTYWRAILANVVNMIPRDAAIFPSYTGSKRQGAVPRYVSLATAILAFPKDNVALLDALAHAGIHVIKPPEKIAEALSVKDVKRVHHVVVRDALLAVVKNNKLPPSVDSTDRRVILQYLAEYITPTNFDSILDLPILPLEPFSPTGIAHYGSLHERESCAKNLILVTADEAALFASLDNMVSLEQLPKAALTAFTADAASSIVNIEVLGAQSVAEYVDETFGTVRDVESDMVPFDDWTPSIDWFTRFWSWIESRGDSEEILHHITHYHIVPTADDNLVRASTRVFISSHLEPAIRDILQKLDVVFLHESLSSRIAQFLISSRRAAMPSNFPLLMDSLDVASAQHLYDGGEREELSHYFGRLLQRKPPSYLDEEAKQKLLQLPIFPIRKAIHQPSDSQLSAIEFGSILGRIAWVTLKDDCPLPVVEECTFVDIQNSADLAIAIDPNSIRAAMQEFDLLRFSIPFLSLQPLAILDQLVDKILPKLSAFNPDEREVIKHTAFMTVAGKAERARPCDLFAPGSPLAKLYDYQDGKTPVSTSYGDIVIGAMRADRFFLTELTSDIVEDRINHISSNPSSSDSKTKAHHLLDLLPSYLSAEVVSILRASTAKSWIPVTGQSTWLLMPEKCRPESRLEGHLCDMALGIVDRRSISSPLREALGWNSPLDFRTTLKQLRETINLPKTKHPDKVDRLSSLIKHFSARLTAGTLSNDHLARITSIVSAKDWIPTAGSGELGNVSNTLLVDGAEVGNIFKAISPSLVDLGCLLFLGKMGCSKRPQPALLVQTLRQLQQKTSKKQTEKVIRTSMDILREIQNQDARSELDALGEELKLPDYEGVFRRQKDMYYDDQSGHAPLSRDDRYGYPAHSDMSKSLANFLGINFLTNLKLLQSDDQIEVDYTADDPWDMDMVEDLPTRIRNVLNDYDVQYSINEFLANAADAGAEMFEITVDEQVYPSDKVLCLEFARLQREPSLMLYNEQLFSDQDFEGIRRVGRGGKVDRTDSIGRFGLGALSLFYFTQVPIVVSGNRVLILDPTCAFLPPLRGRRRTALCRTLKDFVKEYPEQMLPFTQHSCFSSASGDFNGTLFRLPLRTQPDDLRDKVLPLPTIKKLLKDDFFSLARDALFFTKIVSVQAHERGKDKNSKRLWSVEATRNRDELAGGDDFEIESVMLRLIGARERDRVAEEQNWIVSSMYSPVSLLPEQVSPVLQRLKLDSENSRLRVRLAFQIIDPTKGERAIDRHHLFSGLRLPDTVQLPLHIDSTFAVASDRRSIRFDAPNGEGHLVPEAAYNALIFSELVPSLYQQTLEQLPFDNFSHWPTSGSDEKAGLVCRSFYKTLPRSDVAIFKDPAGRSFLPNAAVISSDEPQLVKDALSRLQVLGFITLPHSIRKMVLPSDELRTVDADYVKHVISNEAQRVLELYESNSIGRPVISALLSYLLDHGVSPAGLPLLIRADSSLGLILQSGNSAPLYYTQNPDYQRLFPSSLFVDNTLDDAVVEKFVDKGFNAHSLKAECVVSLLKSRREVAETASVSDEDYTWIEDFRRTFLETAGPVADGANLFSAFPLIPTQIRNYFVSKAYADTPGNVVSDPGPDCNDLKAVLSDLGIVVISGNPSYYGKPFKLRALLLCLEARSNEIADSLRDNQRDYLARFFTDHQLAITDFDEQDVQVMISLPIWRVFTQNSVVYSPVNRAKMLPRDVRVHDVASFLDSNFAYIDYSAPLERILIRNRSRPILSINEIPEYIRIPETLTPADLDAFGRYLQIMILHGLHLTRGFRVPNENLVMKNIATIYNHLNPLFFVAFETSQSQNFIHSSFREAVYYNHLRASVISHIDSDVFFACAQAIDYDVRVGYHAEDDMRRRCRVIWNYYNEQLPPQVMANIDRWREIDHCRFVERHPQRSRTATYDDPGQYCVDLPGIVSPSQIIKNDLASVAWTQRCLCLEAPSQNLLAVNAAFGIPHATEVVNHLIVLATEVARDHGKNATLLSDLTETYRWLLEHKEAARDALLEHREDELFLNVDDPHRDAWRWSAAVNIIFGLSNDEHELVVMRRYLLPYGPLLAVSGAQHIVHPNVPSNAGYQTEEPQDVSWRRTANEMREKGVLLDMRFEPTLVSSDSDDPVKPMDLRAHTFFLSMLVPHFLEAFSGWAEGESKVYSFDGTDVCAFIFLEYLYTGDIKFEVPEDATQATNVLHNLLDLLKKADEWRIPDLLHRVGYIISDGQKLVTPYTCKEVLERATMYNAPILADYCRKFEEANQGLCDLLSQRTG